MLSLVVVRDCMIGTLWHVITGGCNVRRLCQRQCGMSSLVVVRDCDLTCNH